jgi:hypothetical protein
VMRKRGTVKKRHSLMDFSNISPLPSLKPQLFVVLLRRRLEQLR